MELRNGPKKGYPVVFSSYFSDFHFSRPNQLEICTSPESSTRSRSGMYRKFDKKMINFQIERRPLRWRQNKTLNKAIL
jgi:hypothetical protein